MSECSCPPWVNSVEETCDNCKVEINEYHRMVERFAEVNAELSASTLTWGEFCHFYGD